MLFNSLEFFLFLAVFFLLWPLFRSRNNPRWVFLTFVSFFFYGWWDFRYLALLLGSGLIDFGAALAIVRWPRRKLPLLVISMAGNIGSLVFFKYLDFLVQNLNDLLGLAGIAGPLPLFHLVLPVGISFYTFQSMSYTIDVYRGTLAPTRNIFHFFAFISLFPQLVAGPIVRAVELLPQLEGFRAPTRKMRWDGLKLIAGGFAKKVLIADNFAIFIENAFSQSSLNPSTGFWWLTMVLFAFQIYCDFSGYSDIARGLGKWIGYEFPLNFNHPYIATSVREFWTRWHISLSTWFRDYLYIPLGGSKNGEFRAHINLWITMVVSGLWHGASWTFIIWGALHAAYVSAEKLTGWPRRLTALPGGRIACAGIVFCLVLVSWVFFRARSVSQAFAILECMFRPNEILSLVERPPVLSILLLAAIVARQMYFFFGIDRGHRIPARFRVVLGPIGIAVLIVLSVYLRGPGTAFIYFQF